MSGYELKNVVGKKASNNLEIATSDQPDVVVVNPPTTDNEGRPLDRLNLVFFILILHGVGTLMPWNMFINAEDYFRDYKLLPPATNASGSASQLPNLIFNGLNLLVNLGSGNLSLRVNIMLAIEAAMFTLTIILAVVDSSQWPVAFFYITMASVALINMASGVYQNCIFGTGAKFPSNYTNAILIGSNLSGIFTSTVKLISIWLAPEPQKAAMYYFITALFVVLACFISYNLLPKNNFFRYFDSLAQGSNPSQGTDDEERELDAIEGSQSIRGDVPKVLRDTVNAMVPRPKSGEDTSCMAELERKWKVFLECWPQCLNVFFTFYVTLAAFPAIMVDIHEVGGTFGKKYFTPFACFFIFNIFAMIGNLISGWTTWPGKRKVWYFVVLRWFFVPFFLFCNLSPTSRRLPVIFKSDWTFIIGNILFALSSGYLSSICMMFASSGLKSDEASKAGMLAAFFLVLGLFIGINSSSLYMWIIR